MITTVFLVRHGQTDSNITGFYIRYYYFHDGFMGHDYEFFAVGSNITTIQKGTRKGITSAIVIPRLCLKLPFILSMIRGIRTMTRPIADGAWIETKKEVKMRRAT
ncbi:hypothetical protein ACFLTK_05630 [Chloroflexota bacterium]